MSSNYLTTPKFRACSETTGLPLVGYKLHTYAPATTTNKATYPTVADMLAGTNANTNPVTLDSNGEAVIVLKGTTKLVLKDTLGNVIWTQDNVEANTVQMDANGNEIIKYSATSSAVNELTVANSATGFGPTISATGDDTNIDINITPKGSGNVVITNISAAGTSTVFGTAIDSAEIRLYEQATNGSNYTGIKAPATLAANVMYTMPSADGTSGYALTTNGSKTLAWTDMSYLSPAAASDTVAGKIEIAVQSEMETGSSTSLAVTPGRQIYHNSAAKLWGHCNTSGGINVSYNVSSISDVGNGRAGVNFTTAFSGTTYAFVATVEVSSVGYVCNLISRTASSIEMQAAVSSTLTDPGQYHFVAFGDLA